MDQAMGGKDIGYESGSDGDGMDLSSLAVGDGGGEALEKGREGELGGSDLV